MESTNRKVNVKGQEGLQRDEEETGVLSRPSEKESEADGSDCSLASTASTASGVQARKRRQPYLCKPGMAKKPAVDDADISDPYEAAPTTRAKKDLPSVEDLQKELQNRSFADVGAQIVESVSTIEKVVDSSRNLKGTHAHSLRIAARTALAAVAELAKRTSTTDLEKLQRENGELRLELTNLRSEVVRLTTEVNNLHKRRTGLENPIQQVVLTADEDPIVHRIEALMDRKLAAFKAEVFPEIAARPPLEIGSEITQTDMTQKKKKNGKSKKTTKNVARPPQLVTEKPSTPLVDPNPELSDTATWSKVVGRKARKQLSRKSGAVTTRGPTTTSSLLKKLVKPPVSPKTAAVTLTLTENSTVNYASVMAAAKERVSLMDCGILQVRQKRAITGGLVLEVPGPDSAKKADALAERLRVALVDMGVRVARPIKTGEVRVMDLDESITKQDIATAIAESGGCLEQEVKVGEIRLNTFRLGTVWVRCPLTVVRKLAEEKHVRVGWVSARVQVLAARKLQCFRCLEMGHVRKQCQNAVDRSSCCYNCGEIEHKARECKAQSPKCPLCADLGRPADHRLGSDKCNPPKNKTQAPTGSRRVRKEAQSANEPTEEATRDLLQQCLAEWSVALAVLAEPYKVPNNPRWFGSVGDSVAIYWGGGQGDPFCSILERGPGYVAVEWGPFIVIGCYISPNSGLDAYESYLDELAICIRRYLPRPMLVLGDFNAHSRVWGDKRNDRRGDIIQEWAAELDLRLLNQGSTSTCVRW
ncbi:jg24555, partial [Pararge aegeria aegeria]